MTKSVWRIAFTAVTIASGAGHRPAAAAAADDGPRPPADLKAVVATERRVDLTWVDRSTDEDLFIIDRGEKPEKYNRRFEAPANQAFYRDEDVRPGVSYFYRVTAKAGSKLSDPSDEARVATRGDFKLVAPKPGAKQQPTTPTLTWGQSDGASAYRLELREDGRADNDFEVLLPADRRSFQVGSDPAAPKVGPLDQGTAHRWNVVAVHPDGEVAAANGPAKFVTRDQPQLVNLVRNKLRLSLHRAFEGDEAGDGAQFSYAQAKKRTRDDLGRDSVTEHSETSAFNFALVYTAPVGPAKTFNQGGEFPSVVSTAWLAAVEGKLSNADFEVGDALRFRLGMRFSESSARPNPAGRIDGLILLATAKYEADQDFDVQKAMAEILLTPNWFDVGIGQFRALPGLAAYRDQAEFAWRPYVGFDAGYTFDEGSGDDTSLERDGSLFRGVLRVKGSVRFPALADAVGLHQLSLYADNTFRYVSNTNGDDIHNYLDSGVQIDLTDNFGLALTYKIGEDSPDFLKEESFNIALTVKF